MNVARALEVDLQRGDRAVASDDRGPLIVTGTRQDQPFVAFTFDVRQSDLPLRVAWPLLLLNTIDHFVQERDGFVSSYETGETWHVPVGGGARVATIVDPRGHEREVPVVDGRAVYAGVRAGMYTLRAGDEGNEDRFAANLGPGSESVIDPPDEVVLAGVTAGEPSRGEAGVRQEIWIWLVLLALGILLVEWLTYHRRMTV